MNSTVSNTIAIFENHPSGEQDWLSNYDSREEAIEALKRLKMAYPKSKLYIHIQSTEIIR